MSATIIPFKLKEPVEPACSFCGTKKSKAKKLVVAESGKAICDKCISVCNDRVAESPK